MKTKEEIVRDNNVLAYSTEAGMSFINIDHLYNAMEEYANECAKAKCTIPVVSGSLPLASADKIMERIVPKYRDANPHDRAVIAGICDEVLDQSGRFLGEVRTRARASNDR